MMFFKNPSNSFMENSRIGQIASAEQVTVRIVSSGTHVLSSWQEVARQGSRSD